MNLLANKYFDSKQLNNIDDVLESLQLLERDLALMNLPYLSNFNYTYIIITRNVRHALKNGLFDDTNFLNRFDGQFAYYYTNALRQYLEGKKIAPAWQKAFENAKQEKCSPLTVMALGVNAHVNNDIPQVLLDTEANPEHYMDFLKVNEIIKYSIDEVIDELDEGGMLAGPKNPVLGAMYKLTMNRIIRLWRRDAWNKYRNLENQKISIDDIEKAASKKANQILLMPS